MSKKKRFYIIWFTAKNKDGELEDGRMEISVVDGGFFNEIEIKRQVNAMFGLEDAYISGFQELTETDFIQFLNGRSGQTRGEGESFGNFL